MVNNCSLVAERVHTVLVTAGLVYLIRKEGKRILLLVLAYTVCKTLRDILCRRKLAGGEVVLITGGASGLGRRMAQLLAKQGCTVVLWDMNAAGLAAVEGEITAEGGKAKGYKVDVTNRAEVYATAKEVQRDVGDVTVLINNAGIVTGKKILECPDELMEKTVAVNTVSHFWTVKAFLPAMMAKKKGTVVTVASMAGIIGIVGQTDYAASKFGAVGFTESLRMEMNRLQTNVNVLCVDPYFIDTGMFDGAKTRFSFLLPILKEKDVAHRIIRGIERQEKVIQMPPACTALWMTRGLPVEWFDRLATFLGLTSAMDSFVGRK